MRDGERKERKKDTKREGVNAIRHNNLTASVARFNVYSACMLALKAKQNFVITSRINMY